MMRPRSTGAPLHLQRKLKPYQLNPKWVRNKEGHYRPKICCWFCNTEGHVEENCQKSKALKDREKSTLPQKTKARAATNQRNKEEKEVSKSTRATKCIDVLDGPTNVIKLMLTQTDKSPAPEMDALPYAANTISSEKDYWETDYWETMTQEYPEE